MKEIVTSLSKLAEFDLLKYYSNIKDIAPKKDAILIMLCVIVIFFFILF